VTNQSQVGRGLSARSVVDGINAHMVREVARAGGRIELVMTCPHAPWEGCACRKPRPGMLLEAAARLGFDPRRSYMVGDAISDLKAGIAAGCQTALVRTGRGLQQLISGEGAGLTRSHGVLVLSDLEAASRWILSRERIALPELVAQAEPATTAA
jgi:D-glycero-D-manno-heptose 1,7-bisphosphate phosphatase